MRAAGGRGFTLIEVLVALSILSLTFLFIMGTLPFSHRAISEARNTYLATQLAQAELDNCMNGGYNYLSSLISSSSNAGGTTTVTAVTNGIQQTTVFTWTMVPSYPAQGVAQADVVVTWSQSGAADTYLDTVHLTAWANK